MDPTAQAGFLDAFFPGPTPAYVPANLRVKLLGASGDVVLDETAAEVVVVVPNDGSTWDDADGPVKSGSVSFGAPSGAWSEPVSGWAMWDDDTDAALPGGRFTASRTVAAASAVPFDVVLTVSIFEES